jgi:hypothetical protein
VVTAPAEECPRPVRRQDAAALVAVLDVLKEQLLVGRLGPDLVRRLVDRLVAEGVDGVDGVDGGDGPAGAVVQGAAGAGARPGGQAADEDRLVQALDAVTQRVRYALAEYDEPPGSLRRRS